MGAIDHDIVNLQQLRFALDNVNSYVYIKDKSSRYLYANKLTRDLLGLSEQEIKGKSDADFFPPEIVERLREIDLKVFSGQSSEEEVVIDYPDKGTRYYLEVKTPIYNHDNTEIIALLGISTDITKQKHLENQVRQLALTDSLTNLANRRQLFKHLEYAQNRSRRHKNFAALCYLDLDDFKGINDQYGHQFGDDLLIEVAKRLKSEVRETDTVARLGGDEFVILVEDAGEDSKTAEQAIQLFVEKIQFAIDQPYLIDGHRISTSASIGYELFCGADKKRSSNDILDAADIKMYQQKNLRKQKRN